MRETILDRQWDELRSLCKKEAEFKRDDRHPKLVKFLGDQIDTLAKELGFRDYQIQHRPLEVSWRFPAADTSLP